MKTTCGYNNILLDVTRIYFVAGVEMKEKQYDSDPDCSSYTEEKTSNKCKH